MLDFIVSKIFGEMVRWCDWLKCFCKLIFRTFLPLKCHNPRHSNIIHGMKTSACSYRCNIFRILHDPIFPLSYNQKCCYTYRLQSNENKEHKRWNYTAPKLRDAWTFDLPSAKRKLLLTERYTRVCLWCYFGQLCHRYYIYYIGLRQIAMVTVTWMSKRASANFNILSTSHLKLPFLAAYSCKVHWIWRIDQEILAFRRRILHFTKSWLVIHEAIRQRKIQASRTSFDTCIN